MALRDTIEHYHRNAVQFQSQYDSIRPEDVHADWRFLLDKVTPGVALDVGAGSGRDALWLARQGWQVTAVEPAQGLRDLAQQNSGDQVRWIDSQLPTLAAVERPPRGYDLILLSAVWMHLPVALRPQAFERLTALLSPGGLLIITLRFGPSDPARPMYGVSVEELQQLAHSRELVLQLLGPKVSADRLQRADVSWQTVCLQAARASNA
ncbi:class I SAM-dependent methyltransferase [Granulosicoccaceae sp. 1_MG-2023]|nr:class I SAM-dependent methyltransferase [Granulosicoccaceae sp. 1_MG-2023]